MFKNEGEVYAVLNNGNIAIWTKTTFFESFLGRHWRILDIIRKIIDPFRWHISLILPNDVVLKVRMTYKIGFLNFIILKNDIIPNKNYGWRDKLKKRRRLLINVTHAST